jgi:hypothetical protein
MPKTRERLLFINPLKRAVDNTIAGTVLIDQYHWMYLLDAPFWSCSAFFAKGLTWKGGGWRWFYWVTRISKADNRKPQQSLRKIFRRPPPTIRNKLLHKEL